MPRFLLCFLLTAELAFGAYAPGKSTFFLSLNGRSDAYRVRSVMVLPGETVSFAAWRAGAPQPIDVTPSARVIDEATWHWRAPRRPGRYPVEVRREDTGETVHVNVLVMAPYEWMRHGVMNGYPIGEYPSGKKGAYARPRGFVEVTEENQETLVSPHFRLGQFLCKQGGGYPKYVALNEALLGKLERVLEKVNAEGIPATTLHVMSGYRTPHYNRLLGNVAFSRHMYGDAADVFPDEQRRDGRMDDLNGDGVVDIRDSIVLRGWIEELELAYPTFFPTGGIGVYESTEAHGPFVHVDARGRAARWSSVGGDGPRAGAPSTASRKRAPKSS